MKKVLLVSSAFLALFISQCSNSTLPSQTVNTDKPVSVSFAIKTTSQFRQVAHKAIISVLASDMDTIKQQMTITDSILHCTLNNIPVGNNRVFQISVYDTNNILRYFGSRTVSLVSGVENVVNIIIKNVSGPVNVYGIIQDSTRWPDTLYNDTTWHDTTHIDTTWHDTTHIDTTWHDTTHIDTTRHDTTHIDTTRHDTTHIDTSKIIGGNCAYDTIVGYVKFTNIESQISDRVSRDTLTSNISYAFFNFYSNDKNTTKRQIMISSKTALKIILNKKYSATGYFETKGTCTPEIYSIQDIHALIND